LFAQKQNGDQVAIDNHGYSARIVNQSAAPIADMTALAGVLESSFD